MPPPAPVWRGLGARGHAAARGYMSRARRSGACRRLWRWLAPPHPTARAGLFMYVYRLARAFHTNLTTTPVEGYLGSRNDEERSEMRYVM